VVLNRVVWPIRDIFSYSLSAVSSPDLGNVYTVNISELCRNDLVEPANNERTDSTNAAMAQARVRSAVSRMLSSIVCMSKLRMGKRMGNSSSALWPILL
jgi:hypothetical protein